MNLFKTRDFVPMLLSESTKPFDDKNYFFELKFDGNRALIFANNKKLEIYNRRKQNITYLYPELQEIKNQLHGDYIFDGEIIMVEEDTPSFSKLQERAHLKDKTKILAKSKVDSVTFIAFDILYKDGNLVDKTLEERKEILDKIPDNNFFVKSKYYKEKGTKLFKFVKEKDLEGIVAKKIDSKYEINTRSKNWIKIKNWRTKNFFVIAYDIKDNHLQVHLASLKNKKYIYVGKVLVYETHRAYKIIKNTNFMDYEVKNFDLNLKKINPKNKVKVAFIELTKNGNLRQPLFIDILEK